MLPLPSLPNSPDVPQCKQHRTRSGSLCDISHGSDTCRRDYVFSPKANHTLGTVVCRSTLGTLLNSLSKHPHFFKCFTTVIPGPRPCPKKPVISFNQNLKVLSSNSTTYPLHTRRKVSFGLSPGMLFSWLQIS